MGKVLGVLFILAAFAVWYFPESPTIPIIDLGWGWIAIALGIIGIISFFKKSRHP